MADSAVIERIGERRLRDGGAILNLEHKVGILSALIAQKPCIEKALADEKAAEA